MKTHKSKILTSENTTKTYDLDERQFLLFDVTREADEKAIEEYM